MPITLRKNFTQFERELLMGLVEPYLYVIEDKRTSEALNVKKTQAFEIISKKFNNTDGIETRRTVDQIRTCYKNMKKKIRKITRLSESQTSTLGGEVSKQLVIKQEPNDSAADTSISHLSPSNSCSLEVMDLEDSILTCLNDSHGETSSNDEEPASNDEEPASNEEEPVLNDEELASNDEEPASETAIQMKQNDPTVSQLNMKNTSQTIPSSTITMSNPCMKTELIPTVKYMQRRKGRKKQQTEQELRMELLREQIQLTKTKTLIHKRLLALLDQDPNYFNIFKSALSED